MKPPPPVPLACWMESVDGIGKKQKNAGALTNARMNDKGKMMRMESLLRRSKLLFTICQFSLVSRPQCGWRIG